MEKEQILKLVELKVKLMEAEKEHAKELDEAVESGSYAFAEGYKSKAMREIEELEKEIKLLTKE